MAMQSGVAAVAADKVPGTLYNHCHQQPPMDEREGFFMWLRGEFAAANAIIDALCHHLREVGEPGDYDDVIGCIQQRRSHWNPILHMQQYFSVAEVIHALQQAGWRRTQLPVGFEGAARKEASKGGRVQNFSAEMIEKDLKNTDVKSSLSVDDKPEGDKQNMEEKGGGDDMKECCDADGSRLIAKEKRNHEVSPKTFVATEICGGRPVNVVDGMELYEELIDDSEIAKLKTLVNDLRAAGRLGKLLGQTFVISKRPMKGHGREMFQFGISGADAPSEDEATAGTLKDLKTEPIPIMLQNVIERLFAEQVVSIKPDSCTIDIYNEGDHSQPHIWPQWFGRPVCLMFLTECEMSFGKVIAIDHPGDYRGALKLSFQPGSILVMQGRSADFTRHAIPSLRKQCILVTFTKLQPKKINASDLHRFPFVDAVSSRWAPPPSRPLKNIPVSGEHFVPIPPPGAVLPVSATRQLIPPPNSIHPYLPMAMIPPAMTFVPPRHHPQPRLPVPGTGVFLPSQKSSGNSSNQLTSTVENVNVSMESDKDRVLENKDGKTVGTAITEVEHHQILDSSEPTGAHQVKSK